MARKKDPVYVVFGSDVEPNKAVVGIKRNDGNGVGVMICEMKNGGRYEFRSTDVKQEDLSGVYAVLWFCKRKSLDAMIDCLEELRREMEDIG